MNLYKHSQFGICFDLWEILIILLEHKTIYGELYGR